MSGLERAIEEAAVARTIEELGAVAFRTLATALDARAGFFTEMDARGAPLRPIAGDAGGSLHGYLAEHLADDPLGRVVTSTTAAVCYLQRHVDARTMHASRAYREFHRVHDFEHHLLARCRGPRALAPRALTLGLVRGRRARPFEEPELRAASLAIAAFRGAARRIDGAARGLDSSGLTPAEARVVGLLRQGLSNAEIAARVGASLATVKSHLHRVFDKLGVRSRTQLIATLDPIVDRSGRA